MATYQSIAANQSNVVLQNTGGGAAGDTLERIIINVVVPLTSSVTLIDGTTTISIFGLGAVIGTWVVEIGASSKNGPWKISTGLGANIVAVGSFT